jgi:hypothetical protein
MTQIGANQMEFQNLYVLQLVKKFTIYYINVYVLEFGSARYMFKNLDENQWEKFQLKKLNTKKFFSYLNS